MKCFPKINKKCSIRLLCAVVLSVVVVADVATLLYGYYYNKPVEDNDTDWFGAQVLCGGVMFIAILLLPITAFFFPAVDVSKLSQVWYAVHVTWSDDWAHHAVVLLYNLQIQPLVDALELNSTTKNMKEPNYWWWFCQGFILAALGRCVVSFGTENNENEESEMAEVGVRNSSSTQETQGSPALLDSRVISSLTVTLAIAPTSQNSNTITIEEIS